MPINYYTLRTELINDPFHLGYSGYLARNDFIGAAGLLDKVGSGSPYVVWRNDVSSKEVVNAIQPADFIKMSIIQAQQLQILFYGGTIDATLSGVRENFSIVFSGASGTINALTSLAQRQGSRAELIFGDGVSIQDSDVRIALTFASGISG